MRKQLAKTISAITCMVIAAAAARTCDAHFLWIKSVVVDGQPNALVYFNESPADESYHFPEKLAKTKLWSRSKEGKLTELPTKSVNTDDRAGLMGPLTAEKSSILQTSQQYGIYGTALLLYHAKHVLGTTVEELNAAGTSQDLRLEIVPVVSKGEVELTVLWDGKPLGGADVSFFVAEEDATEGKTDGSGKATFKLNERGLVGVLANRLEKGKTGELDGKPYKGVMHYASLTFQLAAENATADEKNESKPAKKKKKSAAASGSSILKPLPEPLASFGGVVCDGWLYVYGGHIGEEHEHSAENLSKHFRRIKLEGGAEWEELPMQTAVQGLPLVSHGGKVYRVGGLDIRNATAADPEDLHSTAEFAAFDPAKKEWTALAPLPAARSSHNAVVIGDRLYVVGGWRLEGKSPGTWEQDALVYDFSKPESGWQKLPKPKFKRRALAAGVWNDRLVVIGGINEKGKVSTRTNVFDPQSNTWSNGPKLPGSGIAGFGVSAWSIDGDLYACGVRGKLLRLNDEGSAWEDVGRVETPRFFHQLVPAPQGGLMVVGGASEEGHLATIERVEIKEAAKN